MKIMLAQIVACMQGHVMINVMDAEDQQRGTAGDVSMVPKDKMVWELNIQLMYGIIHLS